jgi:hypothetical protein
VLAYGGVIEQLDDGTSRDGYAFDLTMPDEYEGPPLHIDGRRGIGGMINDPWTPSSFVKRKANLMAIEHWDEETNTPQIVMYATRGIEKGDELLYHYGEKYWKVAWIMLIREHAQYVAETALRCQFFRDKILQKVNLTTAELEEKIIQRIEKMAKKNNDALASPSSTQSVSNPMPAVQEQSPSLKPEEKTEADQSNLPRLNLAEGASSTDESGTEEKAIDEEKRDDNIAERANETTTVSQTKSVSSNPAKQSPQPPMKKEYSDARTQLTNPGFAPYSMPHHPYHPYHWMQHQPGFTTTQVSVPQSLLPGNMMIVEGMQIQVPPGVPPGAIIPVNIPVPNPQHYYGHHPSHHPPNFPGGYPHHPMQNHHQMPLPPPPQSQQQSYKAVPPKDSWSSKVAASSGPAPETTTSKAKKAKGK